MWRDYYQQKSISQPKNKNLCNKAHCKIHLLEQ
nr:MAG TPA: hypothetical protein [Caudoviricetes sp.]